ncbi:glycine cleavage system protein GcvH [bacterium]|nr:glycine cleavage system protein GcvH [bacterium]
MNEGMLCSQTHQYLMEDGDKYFIGLTDYMLKTLGDILSLELPEVGASFEKDEVFGTVESVKGANELYMPVSGTVVEVNEAIVDNPELFNEQSEEECWLIKIESNADTLELSDLMEYLDYREEFDA